MAGRKTTIIGGVDTHTATHHAAVTDLQGRLLADAQFPASPAGYAQMLAWMRRHGRLSRVGAEGTGAYGAGLARYLHEQQVEVLEVPRPDRRLLRQRGKSDPIDAEAAARSVLAGNASGAPKLATGPIEAIRMLRVARNVAVKAKTAAANTLIGLLVTAPEPLRSQLRGLSTAKLIDTCLRLRPDLADLTDPVQAAKSIAALCRCTSTRSRPRGPHPETAARRPHHRDRPGHQRRVGARTRHRCRAARHHRRQPRPGSAPKPPSPHLCGVAPIPASSGKTNRHRLNRGGDRSGNRALHIAAVVRLRYDQRSRDYATRRTGQGLSMPEIIRCQKRYLAREIFAALRADYTALAT